MNSSIFIKTLACNVFSRWLWSWELLLSDFVTIFIFYPVVYFIIKKYAFKGLLFCFVLNACYEFFQRIWGCNDAFYRMLLFCYTFIIAFGSWLWQHKEEKIVFGWKIVSFLMGVTCIILYAYLGIQSKIINNVWQKTSYLPCLYLLPIAEFLIRRLSLWNS